VFSNTTILMERIFLLRILIIKVTPYLIDDAKMFHGLLGYLSNNTK
jgi:hypothetical protein